MTRMFQIFCASAVCAAALTAAGCSAPTTAHKAAIGLTNPLAPSEPHAATPVPDPTSFTVTITDGWTGAAVTGALVSAGNTEVLTGADGTLHVTTGGTCLVLDILADGFLHRRACAKPSITLWPVAGEAETDATRSAAFHYQDRLTDQAGYALDYGVVLGPDLRQRPGVGAIWTAAVAEISEATRHKLTIPLVDSLKWDEGYLVSIAAEAPRCTFSWFKWNISVAGFCWMPTSAYFVTNITIDPAAVERPDVALRALLYSYALNEHALPGLMNATHPAAELSEFERKTLHMMSLRWGTQVNWPDFDKLP